MKRRGSRQELKAATDAFLKRVDPKGKRFGGRAAEAWRRVAGETIASHTMGNALRDGELLVYVDSPVWANELSLMADRLRERVNEELGEDLVSSVRFAVSRRVMQKREEEAAEKDTEAFYAPDKTDAVPLSEQERLQVEYVAAAIHDEELRDAAVRAMTRHLEWKKGTRERNGRETPSE